MKRSAAWILVFAAACASSSPPADEDTTLPPAVLAQHVQEAANQETIRQLQTSLTELLDRIDVLNDRITRLESAPAPAPAVARQPEPVRPATVVVESADHLPSAAPAETVSKAVAGAQIADTYRNGLMLFGRGKMADARRTFQQIFDTEPSGDLADNALFWIGETWFAAGDYGQATKYYRRVIAEFSEGNKAPDAMFKIALAFEKTSDLAMARRTLEDLLQRYPYSTSAASAKLELKRIRY